MKVTSEPSGHFLKEQRKTVRKTLQMYTVMSSYCTLYIDEYLVEKYKYYNCVRGALSENIVPSAIHGSFHHASPPSNS